ncbi:hypothetical protein GPECTOR_38g289 [Gonium pectorale]|uniref:Uncharacterized protein n=1 Tax=Gonium pectorale TaxID=33097 RepID=A0A150GB34_GONPE|nr:hypothetical protein GPECTOR_38g289 [Gonium pectorale]|eukprot:KXZ47052.1 hypothetical protein GPECTOR_38g289 [Gonium pectorale]
MQQAFQPQTFFVPAGVPAPAPTPIRHHSVLKPEHKNSKATRRGPMDEMRQLVRILVKLMPESSRFLTVPDEGGGGNRVKEEHIKDYLNKVLGRSHDASDETPPYPEWGLSSGWAAYLSQLFTWAKGSTVTSDQALRCARRLPGRSWETLSEELEKLRLCPGAWPLPLRKDAVREVQKKYEETGQLPPRTTQPALQIAVPPGGMPAGAILMDPTTLAPLVALTAGMGAGVPAPQVTPVAAAATAATAAAAAATGNGGETDTSAGAGAGAKRPLQAGPEEDGQPAAAVAGGAVNVVTATAGPSNAAAAASAAAAAMAQPMLVRPGLVAVPPGSMASVPASLGYYQGPGPAPKKQRRGKERADPFPNLGDYTELELWHLSYRIAMVAKAPGKANTTGMEQLGDLIWTRDLLERAVAEANRPYRSAGIPTLAGHVAPGVVAPGQPMQHAAAPAPGPAPASAAAAGAGAGAGAAAAAHEAAQAAATGDAAAQAKTGFPLATINLGVNANVRVLQPGAMAGAPVGQAVHLVQQAGQPVGQHGCCAG